MCFAQQPSAPVNPAPYSLAESGSAVEEKTYTPKEGDTSNTIKPDDQQYPVRM